jgi:hypothetical protein
MAMPVVRVTGAQLVSWEDGVAVCRQTLLLEARGLMRQAGLLLPEGRVSLLLEWLRRVNLARRMGVLGMQALSGEGKRRQLLS